MLDMHVFREEAEKIRADHDRRGLPYDNIEKVIELDTKSVSYTHLRAHET